MLRHLPGIAVAAGLAAAGAAGCGSTTERHRGAAASCVGPQLTLSDRVASPGAALSVTGEWFAADCYDTGQPGKPPPLTDLSVSAVQDDKTWQLASGVDATGDHFAFHVPVVLPVGLTTGQASIRVDGYGPVATLRIRPGS